MNTYEFNRKHGLISRRDYNQKMIDYGLQKSHGALMDTCLDNDKGPLSRRAVAEQIFAIWGNELRCAARDEQRERADFAAVMFGPVIGSKMRILRRKTKHTGSALDTIYPRLWAQALGESGHPVNG